MKYNKDNSKVVVDVLYADEILVKFLLKPRYMSWREMTNKERIEFTKINHKWTITIEVTGEDGRLDQHEVAVSTPITFPNANDVFREILESAQELWPGLVIANIKTVFIPGL